MENMRDRFASRDRMGSERAGRERYDYDRLDRPERGDFDRLDRSERPERGEMGERMSRRSSYAAEGIQIDDVANVVEESNAKQLEMFADCIEDVKDEVFASEKEIMKAIDRVAGSVNTVGRNQRSMEAPAAVQPAFDPAMKQEILNAIFGNTDLLNSIREMLEKKEEPAPMPEAPVETFSETPVEEKQEEKLEEKQEEDPIKKALAEYFNNMEDHVHKENVKCYRNVQAALTEQGTQIVDQNKKSLGFLKVFAIVNLMLAVINITLLACFIFGII